MCIKRKVTDRGKRSKTLSEVKPVKNISKNLQSFLEVRPMQKEVFPSHKLRDRAYEYYGLVVKVLDSKSRGPVFKTTGWLQGRLSLSSF